MTVEEASRNSPAWGRERRSYTRSLSQGQISFGSQPW
jgi:hypothetical protein